MSKILLEIQDGDWQTGWDVELKFLDEQNRLIANVKGTLPPHDVNISQKYEEWKLGYRRSIASYGRGIKVMTDSSEPRNFSIQKNGDDIKRELNLWLNKSNQGFQPIRDRILNCLTTSENNGWPLLFIVKSDDIGLRQLPWNLWDKLAECIILEVAVSPVNFEISKSRYQNSSQWVEILAILGNDTDINCKSDRQELELLREYGANTRFLVKRDFQEINENLWDIPSDILYFAGHSDSQESKGRIYINETDSLTIEELRGGLKEAIAKGLKIAIFNSCDGLKLAESLADLQIPQIIVMREPVPDKIAQEFLKYFLKAFISGKIFNLAVREARLKLQALENKFPCASWLPTIYQNPTEMLPTWQDLLHKEETPIALPQIPPTQIPVTQIPPKRSTRRSKPKLKIVLLTSILLTILVMGVRSLGILQPLELAAYDQFMRSRPGEALERDKRLLIVTIDKEDVEYQKKKGMNFAPTSSISDEALAQLLQILQKQLQPATIGLDIYHEHALKPQLEAMVNNENSNFFFICKTIDSKRNHKGVPPPNNLTVLHYGFNDVTIDKDGIVRRHLLSTAPEKATDPCDRSISFSLLIALDYLNSTQGINIEYPSKFQWQIGSRQLKLLPKYASGYQGIDERGYKILLNYRSYRSPDRMSLPDRIGLQISLKEVLEKGISQNLSNRLDKPPLVLIGNIDKSNKDEFKTPYGREITGVFLHAQMASQIISAVKDNRPLIWWWPWWQESIWIWFWSMLGGFLLWWVRRPKKLLLSVVLSLAVLWIISFWCFTKAGWVPLVPPALASIGTIIVVRCWSVGKRSLNITR